MYEVYSTLTGYYTAAEAKQQKAVHKTGKVYKGKYYIYNESLGMVNVTKVKGVAGSWIHPKKNSLENSEKRKRKAANKKKLQHKLKAISKREIAMQQGKPRRVILSLRFFTKKNQARKGKYDATYYDPETFIYTDYACDNNDTVTVRYANQKNEWIKRLYPKEGDYVKVTIKVRNWNKYGDDRSLLCGKFLVDDCDFQGPPEIAEISGISCPIDTAFAITKRSKTWKKVSLKSIAKEIAKDAGITLVYDADHYSIKKIKQSDVSNMNFLYETCKDYGLAMKLYNSKLVIFDELDYEQKKAVGVIKKGDCVSWNPHATLTGIYHGVTISYTDSKKKKTLKYTYRIKSGGKVLKIKEKADSLSEAETKAKSKLREENKNAVTVSLVLQGDVKFVSGTCYLLQGFGKFDGKYYIDQVEHSIGAGYKMELRMHRVVGIQKKTSNNASGKGSSEKYKSSQGQKAGGLYTVNHTLTGYYTAAEAKNQKAEHKTGSIYKGSYYIFNESLGMLNISKVKGVAGSWIHPEKNKV